MYLCVHVYAYVKDGKISFLVLASDCSRYKQRRRSWQHRYVILYGDIYIYISLISHFVAG